MSFKKFDGNKPMVSLVEPKFILGVAEILTFGAEKYGKNNWKEAQPEDIQRYKDALMRHQLAYFDGEEIDLESGKSHLYHIGCNIMFLDYFDRNKKRKVTVKSMLDVQLTGYALMDQEEIAGDA